MKKTKSKAGEVVQMAHHLSNNQKLKSIMKLHKTFGKTVFRKAQ
jgi:hypothetical protein